MRVILDECLPCRLIRDLTEEHQVTTVPRQGWGGFKDRELIQRIPDEFDVWITMDANLRYQQSLEKMQAGVIILRAKNNRYETVREFVPGILDTLRTISDGQVIELSVPHSR